MSSSARITEDGRLGTVESGGRLGNIVNVKTGISLAGGGHLIDAISALLGGDEEKATQCLGRIAKPDIDKMYNILGAAMSKVVAAASIREVTEVLEREAAVSAGPAVSPGRGVAEVGCGEGRPD